MAAPFSDALSALESNLRQENATRLAEVRRLSALHRLQLPVANDAIVTPQDLDRLRGMIHTFCATTDPGRAHGAAVHANNKKTTADDALTHTPPSKKQKQERQPAVAPPPKGCASNADKEHYSPSSVILKHLSKDDLKSVLRGILNDEDETNEVLARAKKRQDLVDELKRATHNRGVARFCEGLRCLRRDALAEAAGKMGLAQYGNKEALASRMTRDTHHLHVNEDDDVYVI